MKGQAHYHTMTTEDNLALKTVRKINKLVSEVGAPMAMRMVCQQEPWACRSCFCTY